MNKERKRLIRYIDRFVNDCLIEDKITIFNLIVPYVGVENCYEEGMGLRILFSNIHTDVLTEIKEFVETAKKKTAF